MLASGQPTRHLILVRHSLPEIQAGVPAREWRLSEEGRARCRPLAKEIAARFAPVAIASSDEPKAVETAELTAAALGLSVEIEPDLREHERPSGLMLSEAAFQATIAGFFSHPQELVYGGETASEALSRFSTGIARLLATRPVGDIVVVTHGTVMSLYCASRTGDDPFTLWQSLRLPDLRALIRSEESSDVAGGL